MNAKLKFPSNVIIAKDIKGYENLYLVLTNGQVWSYHTHSYLEQQTDRKGYKKVRLYRDNEFKDFFVHRLVLSAFVPMPEGKNQVNHIDGVKDNNNLNNLEWVTGQENMQKAFEIGLEKGKKGEEHNMAKLTNDDVIQIRTMYASRFNGAHISQRQLAKMFGVRQATIWGILHRKNWAHI